MERFLFIILTHWQNDTIPKNPGGWLFMVSRNKAIDLLRQPFFNQYYLLNATLGKFYWLDGDKAHAREYFLKAIDQTHFGLEKEFIQGLLNKTIS